MDMIVRPYTGISRKPRLQPPTIGLLHAMRGDTTPEMQLPATENWFLTQNPAVRTLRRLKGWGPMADFGIGWYPKTQRVEIMQFGDPFTTRSNWSSGFGAKGVVTWGMDEVSMAIELDQSAAMEAYRGETIDRLIELALWLPSQGIHIAPVHLPPWDQLRAQPVPTGWLGHDETANGIRGGKSDVGNKFPWDRFIDAIDATSVPEPDEPLSDFAALSLKVIKLERDYNIHGHGPPV
jgi:hypothetical protein